MEEGGAMMPPAVHMRHNQAKLSNWLQLGTRWKLRKLRNLRNFI